ncbi:hypothetical protein CENSYa_1653 [Cenarchaeum symbiosum A]|uniref:Uncharacterized protein n=1 Tax=Cenarchaeum symbiosum (strain A) TaxID=414004 RepID=A0RY54_CENSY|nr:hypothetical protein CENSYa_1653 [Cenarchaeum symbiosum A]
MTGKDSSLSSKEALMGTKPGREILKQGLFKSAGYRLYSKYKDEYEAEFPAFRRRFAEGLLEQIKSDPDPAETQKIFAREVGSDIMALGSSEAEAAKARLGDPTVLKDRVDRITDSNFVKMTFPVFSALYDAAASIDGRDDPGLRRDLVEGHIIAIDLSEPMDRIMDRDEDIEYLDDYRLMNPYILNMARAKIARGGKEVLRVFEEGFREAREGQRLDVELKSRPTGITGEEMEESYKKYRSVMGTAGRNMALDNSRLGEAFYTGMAGAAEGVGCGNEIEDSIRDAAVKVPSWPLYYALSSGSVRRGFELAMERGRQYLRDARLGMGMLPEGFEYRDFLEFLFLSVEHYNEHWYGRLQKSGLWDKLEAGLPVAGP